MTADTRVAVVNLAWEQHKQRCKYDYCLQAPAFVECTCMHAYAYACMHACMHIYVDVCTYAICVLYVYFFVCFVLVVCVCIYIYTYIHTTLHVHTQRCRFGISELSTSWKHVRQDGGGRADARRKEEEKTTDPGDEPETVLERGGLLGFVFFLHTLRGS